MGYRGSCQRNCPYRESVTGACEHDFEQALLGEFTENPGVACPFAE